MESKVKSPDFKNFVLSFDDASALNLSVSSSIAQIYYTKSQKLPSNKAYFEQLLKLHDRLDSFILSFFNDKSF